MFDAELTGLTCPSLSSSFSRTDEKEIDGYPIYISAGISLFFNCFMLFYCSTLAPSYFMISIPYRHTGKVGPGTLGPLKPEKWDP